MHNTKASCQKVVPLKVLIAFGRASPLRNIGTRESHGLYHPRSALHVTLMKALFDTPGRSKSSGESAGGGNQWSQWPEHSYDHTWIRDTASSKEIEDIEETNWNNYHSIEWCEVDPFLLQGTYSQVRFITIKCLIYRTSLRLKAPSKVALRWWSWRQRWGSLRQYELVYSILARKYEFLVYFAGIVLQEFTRYFNSQIYERLVKRVLDWNPPPGHNALLVHGNWQLRVLFYITDTDGHTFDYTVMDHWGQATQVAILHGSSL